MQLRQASSSGPLQSKYHLKIRHLKLDPGKSPFQAHAGGAEPLLRPSLMSVDLTWEL